MRASASLLIFAVAAFVCVLVAGLAHAQTTPAGSNTAGAGIAIPAEFNQTPAKPDAQQQQPQQQQQQAGTITINGVRYYLTTKTPYEYYLAVVTVVIGVITMLLVCWLFYGHIADKTDDFVKLFAFVVVVFSALFLIAVGYSDTQTAPVYSLLGTIIGYLFGRDMTMRQQKADTAGTADKEPAPAGPQPAVPQPGPGVTS